LSRYIAKNVAPGAHVVLLLDQAGWHTTEKLDVPANITLLPLPPRCPELNPAENVWQFMRDNWLSNRVFKSYDDVVDHCCHAWNKLVDRAIGIILVLTGNPGSVPRGNQQRALDNRHRAME
jgi:hypothetical protein